MTMVAPPRPAAISGLRHHWTGARLPKALPTKPTDECWRCTEIRAKRVLRRYEIGLAGTTVVTVLLCADCVSSGTPLDPDPLYVAGAG